MKVNLVRIKERLFDCARERIATDYKFDMPTTPSELSERVLLSLDQRPVESPLTQQYGNGDILRATVRAIGSNSRPWRTFLKNESCIEKEIRSHRPLSDDLAKLLPGLTAKNDASAILKWVKLLEQKESYYAHILEAAKGIKKEFERESGGILQSEYLFLCVVAHFTDPSKLYKWPGMGFALGSEFLRNLHWDGFKPDRHIKRLLKRWTADRIDVCDLRKKLLKVIGRADDGLSENLKWSLVGIEVTPTRMSFSQVDNLIWLLGAYVEKRGRESDIDYMLP